jgi:hypothetical protein
MNHKSLEVIIYYSGHRLSLFKTSRIRWVTRVEIIVILVAGLVVTSEARDLVRLDRNQRT